jgi:hypothetical protein
VQTQLIKKMEQSKITKAKLLILKAHESLGNSSLTFSSAMGWVCSVRRFLITKTLYYADPKGIIKRK